MKSKYFVVTFLLMSTVSCSSDNPDNPAVLKSEPAGKFEATSVIDVNEFNKTFCDEAIFQMDPKLRKGHKFQIKKMTRLLDGTFQNPSEMTVQIENIDLAHQSLDVKKTFTLDSKTKQNGSLLEKCQFANGANPICDVDMINSDPGTLAFLELENQKKLDIMKAKDIYDCHPKKDTIKNIDRIAESGTYSFHADGKIISSIQITTKTTSDFECTRMNSSDAPIDKGPGVETSITIYTSESPWFGGITCNQMSPIITFTQQKTDKGEVLQQELEQLLSVPTL